MWKHAAFEGMFLNIVITGVQQVVGVEKHVYFEMCFFSLVHMKY